MRVDAEEDKSAVKNAFGMWGDEVPLLIFLTNVKGLTESQSCSRDTSCLEDGKNLTRTTSGSPYTYSAGDMLTSTLGKVRRPRRTQGS